MSTASELVPDGERRREAVEDGQPRDEDHEGSDAARELLAQPLHVEPDARGERPVLGLERGEEAGLREIPSW